MKNLLFIILLFIISCHENDSIKVEEEKVKIDELNKNIVLPSEKKKYTVEQIKFLDEVGLKNSETVKTNNKLLFKEEEEYYKKKFGLLFVSEQEVQKRLEEKDLLIGELAYYIGNIPPENIEEFKNNLNTVQTIDSSFKPCYFLRVSRRSKINPGMFLQKISTEDLIPELISEIESGPGFAAHGQSTSINALKDTRRKYYELKYGYTTKDIEIINRPLVVDHNSGPEIKIIADKHLFNMDGKTILNNEIKVVDPAIVMKVPKGYLILTDWE